MAWDLTTMRRFIPIIRSRIDDELEMQPEYYWHAAESSALALSRRDEASALLKEEDARIYAELNVPGADQKLPSDAKILRELALDPRHLRAEKAVREAQLEVNMWAGMVETFNKRNSMLSRLADMMISGILQKDSVAGSRDEIETSRKAMSAAREQAAQKSQQTAGQGSRRVSLTD